MLSTLDLSHETSVEVDCHVGQAKHMIVGAKTWVKLPELTIDSHWLFMFILSVKRESFFSIEAFLDKLRFALRLRQV